MSVCVQNPPALVSQVDFRDTGVQDSASPICIKIQLSERATAALTGAKLIDAVHVALRRFDGAELQVARTLADGTQRMQGLRTSQGMFGLFLRGNMLEIKVRRKCLPVSRTFGDAGFIMAVLIVPCDELVCSTPFLVVSKGRRERTRTARRVRGVCPAAPVFGEPSISEVAVNRLLRGDTKTRPFPPALAPFSVTNLPDCDLEMYLATLYSPQTK